MYRIAYKRKICDRMYMYKIEAPLVAKKALPGQFIILRTGEGGERIPLTVADTDPKTGLVTIIFQVVGETTWALSRLKRNECIEDFVGPLGKPTELDGIRSACVIGGGAGTAIAYPQAKALHKMGASVDVITGFRTSDLIILEKELGKVSDGLFVMTDDGSNGNRGFVTQKLRELIDSGKQYDEVIAIGPLPMMKAVCEVTKDPYIKTVISMNSIMLDGTGMCGACRLTVDGKTKFACVDGPDFDGHLVDFDEAMMRSRMYRDKETEDMKAHKCRLLEVKK